MHDAGTVVIIVAALAAILGVWTWRGPALFLVGLLISVPGLLAFIVGVPALGQTTAAVLFVGGWILAGLGMVLDELRTGKAVARTKASLLAPFHGVPLRQCSDGTTEAWFDNIGWQSFANQAEAERFIAGRRA